MASNAIQSIIDALELVGVVERTPGVRPLIALTVQVERWLPVDRPLPEGIGAPDALGHPLGPRPDGGRLWLLPGGRLLEIPADGAAEPRVVEIGDDLLPRSELAEALRDAVIGDYLGRLDLAGRPEHALPTAVAELVGLAERVDGPARLRLLSALSAAMRADEAWAPVAVRLRSAFEHFLGDRDARVRDVASRALVTMAARGPRPAAEIVSAERMLDVPFASRDPVIVRAALDALLGLPESALDGVRGAAVAHAATEVASVDDEVRRLAGAFLLRAGGQAETAAAHAVDRALALGASESERSAALRALAAEPEALGPRLPLVLDALADPSPTVRQAALACARALLQALPTPGAESGAGDGGVKGRLLTTLLGSTDPALVSAGLDLLGLAPVPLAADVRAALEAALDGPEATKIAVVDRLADTCPEAEVEAAADTYALLLRHPDVRVRTRILERLASDARDRATLRDRLTHDLVEHLHDPDPALRVATARTVHAMGFPNALALIAQLAADPDAEVRQGAIALLANAGDDAVLAQAAATAQAVSRLVGLAARGDGDSRIAWSAALEHLAERHDPSRAGLLVHVLRSIPPDSGDDFLRFAIGELDTVLLDMAADPASRIGGSLGVARRFLEPPAEPRHAARIAGLAAQAEPAAFDLLWTMFTRTAGLGSEAARKALAELARAPKSDDVRSAIEDALAEESDDARRDVLRTLLGRGRGPGRRA